MIYDLIYHCKKGWTKVSIKFLEQAFDTSNFDEILIVMAKLKIKRVYTDGTALVLEI